MLARVTVPFADSSATQLRWRLSPAAARPLVATSVLVGGLELRLTVLGASHQVEAQLGGGLVCVESVTCEGGSPPSLPGRAERQLGDFHYRFSSVIEHLDEQTLSLRALRLRSRLALDAQALLAFFPGHPHAVTALAVRSHGRGTAWRTWHAYPATGELVRTSTRLVVL